MQKRAFYILLVIFLFIFFKGEFDTILKEVFAETLFRNISSFWLTDIIVLIGGVWLVVALYNRAKLDYKYSFFQFVIVTFIISIYTIYRIQTPGGWTFVHFTFAEWLYYNDIIYLSLVFPTARLFIAKKKFQDPVSFFVEDNAIDFSAQNNQESDLLGRSEYAEHLADKIGNQIFKSSFSIGVLGEWGTGKSSFLSLLKNRLDDGQKIIIQFSPWDNHGGPLMLHEFFNVLGAKLQGLNPQLAARIGKYGDQIMTVDKSGIASLIHKGIQLLFYMTSTPVRQQYHQVNKAIRDLNKQIIVFIDDVDRLSSEEIIELFKLIRNTANFPNTVFLIALDKDYAIDAIGLQHNSKKKDFIEKFFQLEVSLPHWDENVIRSQFLKYLEGKLNENEIKVISENMVVLAPGDLKFMETIFDRVVRNLRDAKKCANLINLDIERLRVNDSLEVDIQDFFFTKLLKFKYPNLYTILFRRRGVFFNQFNNVFEMETKMVNKEERTILKEIIEQEQENLRIHDSPLAVDLIDKLFGESQEIEPRNLSIRNPRYFDNYFKSFLAEGGIRESEFREIFNLEDDDRIERLKRWVQTDPDQLFEKLSRFTYSSTIEFERVVLSLFFLSNTTENLIYQNKILNELGNLIFYNKLRKEGIYSTENKLGSFVNQLFSSSEHPHLFESNVIRRLLDDNVGMINWKDKKTPKRVWGNTLDFLEKQAAKLFRILFKREARAE